MLPVIAEQLYYLSEICLSGEHIFDAFVIEHKAISGKLKAMLFRKALPQIGEKLSTAAKQKQAVAVCHQRTFRKLPDFSNVMPRALS